MAIWNFYDYVAPNGRNIIAGWIDKLSVAAAAKVEARLDYLGGRERGDWTRPYFAPLKNCAGISEIIFVIDKKQHRIFGFFGPDRHEYTMLLGWIKKNGDYSRPCNTAITRMNIANSDRRRFTTRHGT